MKVPGSQSEFRSFLTAQFVLPDRTVGSFAHAEEVGKVEIKVSDRNLDSIFSKYISKLGSF